MKSSQQKSQICSNVNCRLAGPYQQLPKTEPGTWSPEDAGRRTPKPYSPSEGIVLSCLTASLHAPAKVFGRWQLDLVLSDLSLNINSRVQPSTIPHPAQPAQPAHPTLLVTPLRRDKSFHWQVRHKWDYDLITCPAANAAPHPHPGCPDIFGGHYNNTFAPPVDNLFCDCLDKQVCGSALSKIYSLRLSDGWPGAGRPTPTPILLPSWRRFTVCDDLIWKILSTFPLDKVGLWLEELAKLWWWQSLIKSGLVWTWVRSASDAMTSTPTPCSNPTSSSHFQSLLFFGFALICICGFATTSSWLH